MNRALLGVLSPVHLSIDVAAGALPATLKPAIGLAVRNVASGL